MAAGRTGFMVKQSNPAGRIARIPSMITLQ